MQNQISSSKKSARFQIFALAKSRGVRYQRLAEDDLAEVVTRLSDDEVATDDVEDLVVALRRSGTISGSEMVDLLGQYLNEKVVIKHMEHNLFRANLKEAFDYLSQNEIIEYADFLEVHKILFGDYYPWAGQDRLATAPHLLVSKAETKFCEPPAIRLAVDQGLRLAQHHDRVSELPGEIMGLFAYGHPFLDGNGRAMLLVHMELAYRAGFSINWSATNKSDYLYALTREIESPGNGILDQYLTSFMGPRIERGQLAGSALSMRGLDGLDGENRIEGDLRDESVAEKYRQFDEARNYSYRIAGAEGDNSYPDNCDPDDDEDQEPGPAPG